MARPWWIAWPLCGLAAMVVYPLWPGPWTGPLLSLLIGLGACAVMVTCARRRRAPQAPAWYLFAAGIATWVLGDLVYAFGPPAFPSWADALYLGAYPMLAVALFRLSRPDGRRGSGSLIDSTIVAISVGIVYWTFLIEPIVTDPTVPVLTRAVTAGYPTVGVLLCALVAPMLVRRGPRSASLWLLTAGSLVSLTGNLVYTLLPAVMATAAPLVYASFLLAYACWAAAAAHPSMALVTPRVDGEGLGRARLVLLTTAMLLVPAVLVVQGDRGGSRLSWLVVAIGSMALFVLVVARMAGYIARVDSQARQLRDLAMRDELTGLPNRRDFEQRVTEAVAAGACQLVMIDLAGFKHVNDRLGRRAGDQALVAVAGLLRDCVRAGDVVARMGADEFAVLVRDTQPGDGAAVADRLVDRLRRPVLAGEYELLLNARIGLADSAADLPGGTAAPTAAELIRRADTARYAAKAGGRHLLVYTDDLDARADAAARLGADLRHSLDDGDFHLVYQPIVELGSARTVAVEALVRWRHPVRGAVSPADFVPAAEDNGLIVELGEWVMRTACRQFARWRRDLGPDAPRYISVNVSARQLSEPGFPDVVAGILADAGLAPAELLVEVTETALFGGGVAVGAVETLHRRGVGIALDDFGTGHSSLGLLRTVPVDVLKVDKSFVDEITGAGHHAVIAEALIHVSDGLGLRAVAEGVETVEQAVHLRELGYRYAQGYYFGRPVAEPDFRAAGAPLPGSLAATGQQ